MNFGARFGVWDYSIFFTMLLASSAIGIYYAFKAAKKPQAPKSMGAIPVAMSLISTSISPVAMLGIPAEMYFYGLGFIMIQLGLLFTVLLTNHIYMPMFYNLDVTSAFQYLELRFNRTLRTICSVSSALQMIVYMSIVLYGPALALQQVTGVNLWLSVVSIGVVCTFYTTVGGIKAIVMADVFMSFIKYASIILLAVKGTIDVGGWHSVYEKNLDSQRLYLFDFRPDPTVRHSVWSLVIGGTFLWLTMYAVNQGWVQRYLSMPNVATVRRAMWINLLGVIGLQSALCYVGLVIFTRYNDCDPISTRQVAAADQVNPFFVMDILGSYPGVPGLIVSGIFSGGLSGVSASLSSLATTTLQDIVKTYIKPDLGDRAAGILLKVLTVVFGVIVVAMVYVAQQMGDVLQSALSILGIVGGPLVGVYSLGIFVPFANSIGAITGLVAGVTTLSWISVGAYLRRPFHWRPPVSVNGCVPLYLNATGLEQPVIPSVNIDAHNSQIEYIYRLSYLWYSFLGAFIVLVLGSFISLLTVRWSKPVEERLLIRITCKCFSRRGTQQDAKSPSVDNEISHGIGPFFVEPIVTDSSQHNLAGLATSSKSPVTLLTTSKKQKPLEELAFRTLNGTVQNKVSNVSPPEH
ncbi:sodium-coupled monocarboxylate transporter 1 [Rhipicephalus sanguineus]|uniref:sodium-coupled monocarboxylate transporter 1 n=1 Tax=Rhipicephalus sanguineus TaxID=34632 RepID=UPI0020C37BD5|nr:sodium-coupled monocarboxylate transporter 1 [Rhipicephalus sanguineus]